jgi:hypothetical protein
MALSVAAPSDRVFHPVNGGVYGCLILCRFLSVPMVSKGNAAANECDMSQQFGFRHGSNWNVKEVEAEAEAIFMHGVRPQRLCQAI